MEKYLGPAVAFVFLLGVLMWLTGSGPWSPERSGYGRQQYAPQQQSNSGGQCLRQGKPGDRTCFRLGDGTLRCPNTWKPC